MTPSPASSSCPRCGSPLDPASSAGLCPRCLLAMNLRTRTMPTGEQPSSSPPPAPAELEAKFPQFEILECLGRGGMGVVYKARQKALDRIVAIKILAGEFQDDPGFAARFEKEAKLLARLNHPNIVTIHDFGHAGGLFHIVMEYIDGVNVRDLLRDGRLEPQQALAIVPPICDALQFAHDHGVVHRDIKPENILLDREGRVKIADFGIATMAGEAADKSGTPAYMAPEIGGHTAEIDHRADIYSLGVVLYEMLTGERPAKQFEVPSNRVLVDVKIDQIVLRALQGRPELRYQTAGEFKTVVETMANTPPPPPSATPTAPATLPPKREPRPEIAAAAKTMVDPSPASAPVPAMTSEGEPPNSKARWALILMFVALFGPVLLGSLDIIGNPLTVLLPALLCGPASLILAIQARRSRAGKVVIATWCTLLGVGLLLMLVRGGQLTREPLLFMGGLLLTAVVVALGIALFGSASSADPAREKDRKLALWLTVGAIFGTPLLVSLVRPTKEDTVAILGACCALAAIVFAIRARHSRTGKVVLAIWIVPAFGILIMGAGYQILLRPQAIGEAQRHRSEALEQANETARLQENIQQARQAIRIRPDAEPRIRIDFNRNLEFIEINGVTFRRGEFHSVLADFVRRGEQAPVRIYHDGPEIENGPFAGVFSTCQFEGLRRITFWNGPSKPKKTTQPDVMLALGSDLSVTIDGKTFSGDAISWELKRLTEADPDRHVRITALSLEQDMSTDARGKMMRDVFRLMRLCEWAKFKQIFLTTESAVARSWQSEAESLAGGILLPDPASVVRLKIAEDGGVTLDGRSMSRTHLSEELRSMALQNLNRPVRVQADPAVDYLEVLGVLDLCRNANLANVSFAAVDAAADEKPSGVESLFNMRFEEARRAAQGGPRVGPHIGITLGKEGQQATSINEVEFAKEEFDDALKKIAPGHEGLPVTIISPTERFSTTELVRVFGLCSDLGLKRLTFWNVSQKLPHSAGPRVMVALSGNEEVSINGEKVKLEDSALRPALQKLAALNPATRVNITAVDFEKSVAGIGGNPWLSSRCAQVIHHCQMAGFNRIFFTTEANSAKVWQKEADDYPKGRANASLPGAGIAGGGGGTMVEPAPEGKGPAMSVDGENLRITLRLDEASPGLEGFVTTLKPLVKGKKAQEMRVEITSLSAMFPSSTLLDLLLACRQVGLYQVNFNAKAERFGPSTMPPLIIVMDGDELPKIAGLTVQDLPTVLKQSAGTTPMRPVQVACTSLGRIDPTLSDAKAGSRITRSVETLKMARDAGFRQIYFTTEAAVAEKWEKAAKTVTLIDPGRNPGGATATMPAVDGGGLTRIQIAEDDSIWIDGRKVERNELLEELRSLAERQGDRPVQIETGEEVAYTKLLGLIDLCSQAPLTNLSLVYRPRAGQMTPPVALPLTVPPRGKQAAPPLVAAPRLSPPPIAELPARIEVDVDGTTILDGRKLSAEALHDELRKLQEAQPGRAAKLVLHLAASKKNLQSVIENCGRAGFTAFSFVYLPPGQKEAVASKAPARAAATLRMLADPDGAMLLNGRKMERNELVAELTKLAAANPLQAVEISAEAEPPYTAVTDALEFCALANISYASFAKAGAAGAALPVDAGGEQGFVMPKTPQTAAVRIALTEDGAVSVDGKVLAGEKLLEELKRLKADLGGNAYVEIATDSSTSYKNAVGVLDLCHQAGLTNLNILQPALQDEPPLPAWKDSAQGIVLPGPPDHPPTQIFIPEGIGQVMLEDELMFLHQLGPKLTEIARGDPYRKILVTGDHAASHERVREVMKICKEANLTQVRYERARDRLQEIELNTALKAYADLQSRLREERLKLDLLAAEGGANEEMEKAEKTIEVLQKAIDEEREKVRSLEE